jgi:hypothetical protein
MTNQSLTHPSAITGYKTQSLLFLDLPSLVRGSGALAFSRSFPQSFYHILEGNHPGMILPEPGPNVRFRSYFPSLLTEEHCGP